MDHIVIFNNLIKYFMVNIKCYNKIAYPLRNWWSFIYALRTILKLNKQEHICKWLDLGA